MASGHVGSAFGAAEGGKCKQRNKPFSQGNSDNRDRVKQDIEYLIGDILIHQLGTITIVNTNIICCGNKNEKELVTLMDDSAEFLIDLKQSLDKSVKLSQKYK
jgi:hypothetical protein